MAKDIEKMTIFEVCKELRIEKYAKRIFGSSSTGELFFLQDYYDLLVIARKSRVFADGFPEWMDGIIKRAESKWSRPESVFQHILRLLAEDVNHFKKGGA